MPGEFFRGNATGGEVLGELFRAKRPCAGLGGDAAHFRLVAMGGFALHEAFLRRVAGVSDPRVVQFPPTGGGADAVCSAGAPKPQTTSVKNTENGLGGVWVFRTVCFERVVLSSPGCLWPGRMDDHEEVLEAHA